MQEFKRIILGSFFRTFSIFASIFIGVSGFPLLKIPSVLAQCNTPNQPDCPGSINLPNPVGFGSVPEFIEALLRIVTMIGVPIAVFFIIYAGFLFVTAQGNPTKLATARKALLAALVGTAILLGAWVIATAIKGTVDNIRQ